MKVLSPGRAQKGWAQEFDCTGKGNGGGGCGARLLVEYGDLYKTHSYDYGGGHDVYITFRCGACGVETDIKYTGPNRSGIRDKTRSSGGGWRD